MDGNEKGEKPAEAGCRRERTRLGEPGINAGPSAEVTNIDRVCRTRATMRVPHARSAEGGTRVEDGWGL